MLVNLDQSTCAIERRSLSYWTKGEIKGTGEGCGLFSLGVGEGRGVVNQLYSEAAFKAFSKIP